MLIRAGYKITYDCPAPTPMTLLLSVRPERLVDLVTTHRIAASGQTPLRQYRDLFGNIAHRLVAPAGPTTFRADFVIEDSGLPDPVDWTAVEHPIDELPDEALTFLLASRYCETELLSPMAWSLFGGVQPGWARVQAIVDYVHDRIAFGYHHARPTRTAAEAHEERCGVCRDFAHLAVTLCRCMNIPARYCTGYLGDIGIDPIDAPMDFSAWFEVYLGGAWRAFDARHNTPRIGRILMAYGRDAADVAITTSFGTAWLTGFEVVTEEVVEGARATLQRA
ncbi:MAG TPA: transglutaminase family protein [Caulobacteraceae bacterium]|jgi:transglutaminase-like putative cysteine protease|nr:transglutaminase family protein [Caulobacteraceae bacterium]